MSRARKSSLLGKITVVLVICCLVILCGNNALALDGSGTEADPWRIKSLDDFIDFASDTNYWAGYTRLEADVNLAGRVYDRAVIAPDTNSSVMGFQGTSFTGKFDGNNYTIYSLIIDSNPPHSDYLGLFGQADENAVIENLIIKKVHITAGDYSRYLGGLCGQITEGTLIRNINIEDVNINVAENSYYIGGIVGRILDGFISDCYVSGIMSSGDNSRYIGGLCGENLKDGIIRECHSGCSMTGTHTFYIGGLCGSNYGTISECYSSSSVNGYYLSLQFGGFCGNNRGTISNCYSTGPVTGFYNTHWAGGFCGGNSHGGILSNNYSTGFVTGYYYVGGFCAGNWQSYCNNCFWDVNTSGRLSSAGGGIGLSTEEMQTLDTYLKAGWDFNTPVWTLEEGVDYPRLWWEKYLTPVIIYLDDDAPPGGNGASWATAYKYLQDALADANTNPDVNELWVAVGTYKPDQDESGRVTLGEREATFQLRNGVTIKGGYAGIGEPDPDARDIEVYETILSGDIGIDGYYWDNSYHVVTGSGTDASAILDGFTITSGNANGVDPDNNGAGMINYFGSPTITNCTFSGNSAVGDGGGMFNWDSSPTLTKCTFSGNSAHKGGGMHNRQYSDPRITNCTFIANSAGGEGGGMRNKESGPTVTNCTFSGNSSGFNGGGIQNALNSSSLLVNCLFSGNWAERAGGGLSNFNTSSTTVTNCTFIGNSAGEVGGGMHNNRSSNPTVTNCTFGGNLASDNGGGMYNQASSPTLTNCTFSGNSTMKAGGGMHNNESNPTLTNCSFTENSAARAGGMRNRINSSPTLINCTFIGNLASENGGGMGNRNIGRPTLINCTFSGNRAEIQGGGVFNDSNSISTLANCILWGNTAPIGPQIDNDGTSWAIVSYSDVQGGLPGAGNIDADPCFIKPGHWVPCTPPPPPPLPPLPAYYNQDDTSCYIWIDGDYHLQVDSPCINAGDPDYIAEPNETDLDGNPRVIGGRIDMGAYEFQNTPPVADAGPDQVVECACNTEGGTKVILDGRDSYDADGDPLTFIWTGPFIESPAHGAIPTVTLDGGCPGEYVIILTVNDGIDDSEPNEVVITVVDTTPPVITCPADVTLECPADTSVEANGSATAGDTCGTVTITHSDQWQLGCGNTGIVTRTWTAVDESDNSSNCVQIITVVDTTPPDFEFSVSPTLLWPPNHKMVEIIPSWTVSDKCDLDPNVSLVSIVANEGDDIIGDGHTGDDIQIDDDGSIFVRSERSGPNTGRIYTITYQAVDDCGNIAVRSATVSIPHEFKLLTRMGERWLWRNHTGNLPEDLNGDGIVNLEDFAKFAENWTK